MNNLKTFEQFTHKSDNQLNEGWILKSKYKRLDRESDEDVNKLLKKSIATVGVLGKELLKKSLELPISKKLDMLDSIYKNNSQEDNSPLATALGIAANTFDKIINKIRDYIFKNLELELI